jgi:hypothetical protein
VVTLACGRVPDLSFAIERAGDDLVAEWVIEGHSIHDISVFIEREQLLSRVGVPNFARAIVATSDKLASILVERTVGQGKQMSSQHLEKTELLLLVLLLFFDQFLNELFKLRLAGLRDKGLFEKNLVNQAIDISAKESEEMLDVSRLNLVTRSIENAAKSAKRQPDTLESVLVSFWLVKVSDSCFEGHLV